MDGGDFVPPNTPTDAETQCTYVLCNAEDHRARRGYRTISCSGVTTFPHLQHAVAIQQDEEEIRLVILKAGQERLRPFYTSY